MRPTATRTHRSRRLRAAAARGPDRSAVALCLLGGGSGLLQLFLSWTSRVPGVDLPGSVSGWSLFRSGQSGASASVLIAVYAIPAVAVVGVLEVLLGLAALSAPAYRKVGLTAVTTGGLTSLAAIFWLFRSSLVIGRGLTEVFAYAGPGWYAFLVSGPLVVTGGLRVLLRR